MNEATPLSGTALLDALDVRQGELISLVGGGGKTSIMFGAARELVEKGVPVVTTTTTKIMEPRSTQTPHLYLCGENGITFDFWEKLDLHHHVTLASGRLPGGKLKGIGREAVSALTSHKEANPTIIVEADGSAQRPIKAPNETEPVVPTETTLLVAVLGVEAIGRPLSPQHVFRPEIYSRMTGLPVGAMVTADSIVASLAHPRGLLRDRPPGARVSIFINKVENESLLSRAEDLSRRLMEGHIRGLSRVITGCVKPLPAILNIMCV